MCVSLSIYVSMSVWLCVVCISVGPFRAMEGGDVVIDESATNAS